MAFARVTAPSSSDNDAFCAGGRSKESCIDQYGNVIPTVDNNQTSGSSALRWSSVYGVSFFGDGSNLTGIPSSGSITNIYLPKAGGTMTGTLAVTGASSFITAQSSVSISGLITASQAGFGTTTPDAKLSVFDSVLTSTSGINIGNTSQTGITGARYVGITQSGTPSNISANSGFQGIAFYGVGGAKGGAIGLSTWHNGVSSGERLFVDQDGKTGIGTSSPATTLDVSGNSQFGTTAKSTITTSGFFIPASYTLAQIRAYTPASSEIGGLIMCSNCASAFSVCQSTGSTIQGFRLGTTGTTGCQ